MGWKILGVLNVLAVIVAIFGTGSHHSALGVIGIAMTVPAAAGVFLYAYQRPVSQRFWRVFSWLFALDSVGVVTFFVVRSLEVGSRHNPLAVALLLGFIVCFQYFTWLALHRLAHNGPQPKTRRPRQRDARAPRWLEGAVKAHPRRMKVLGWTLTIGMLVVTSLIAWQRIAEGRGDRLIVPTLIAAFLVYKAYAGRKAAHLTNAGPVVDAPPGGGLRRRQLVAKDAGGSDADRG